MVISGFCRGTARRYERRWVTIFKLLVKHVMKGIKQYQKKYIIIGLNTVTGQGGVQGVQTPALLLMFRYPLLKRTYFEKHVVTVFS